MAVFYKFFCRKPPVWAENDRGWAKTNWVALVASIIVSVAAFAFYYWRATNVYIATHVSLLVVPLTYIFVQSVYTDFKYMKVDRHVLRLAIASNLVLNMVFLFVTGQTMFFPVWIVLLIFFLALLFVKGIGASDVRALILSAVTIPPIVGAEKFYYAVLTVCGLGVLFIIVSKIVKSIREKYSREYPMIPLILLPMIAVVFLNF